MSWGWRSSPKEMVVVNWNHGQAAKSLPFFGERGNSQVLAGYYDQPPERISAWLKTGEKVPGLSGAMYTTWQNNFRDLETFAKAAWGGKRE